MKFNRFISFTELKYLGLKKGGSGPTPTPTPPVFDPTSGTLSFPEGTGSFEEGGLLNCIAGKFEGSTLDLTQ